MENKFQHGSKAMTADFEERRRFPRIRLQIPMFVRGKNELGEEYIELSKTLDISAAGAFLASERAVRENELVSLTVPSPPPIDSALVPAGTPPIHARVRRSRTAGGVNFLGVEFLKPLA